MDNLSRSELETLAISHKLVAESRVSRLRTCELQKLTKHIKLAPVAQVEEETPDEVVLEAVEIIPKQSPTTVQVSNHGVMYTLDMDHSDQQIINSQKAAMQRERDEAVALMEGLRTKIARKTKILTQLPNVGRLQKFIYQKELEFLIQLSEEIHNNMK